MATRRHFLRSAALVTTATGLRMTSMPGEDAFRGSFHQLHPHIDPANGPEDPFLRELAARAIDAARAAGATYADVRFTADREQNLSASGGPSDNAVGEESIVFASVRALVDGFWGFATSPACTGDNVARMAREAVAQAKVNNWGRTRVVTLDADPPASTGTWTTPVQRDAFTVSVEEKSDFLRSVLNVPEMLGYTDVTIGCDLSFRRQMKVFASTAGAYLTQTLHWTGPSYLTVTVRNPSSFQAYQMQAPLVTFQAAGYEALAVLRQVPNRLPEWISRIMQDRDTTPPVPGRYDIVFDARTTAALVQSTIGYAAEMDRVQGDEVNATGTSYLSAEMLGTPIANPKVTITGSRSVPRGPAGAKWDDEGIAAQPFDLVKDGMLVDFATTRAYATVLEPWYHKRGIKAVSRGCASADIAANAPLVQAPDLVLQPGREDTSFEQMVSNTRSGIAVMDGACFMDRDLGAGQTWGRLYEIRDGQLGKRLKGGVVLFQSAELWKDVEALGGAASAELRGFISKKGLPEQEAPHGVVAVPMKVRNQAFINPQP